MRRPKASRALRFREDRRASPDVVGVFLAVLGIGWTLGALPARATEPAPPRVEERVKPSLPPPTIPLESVIRSTPDARSGVGSGLFFSAKSRVTKPVAATTRPSEEAPAVVAKTSAKDPA
ncbi:hypothetical protein ACYOEI_10180, partial [Singulisphaera rosea]